MFFKKFFHSRSSKGVTRRQRVCQEIAEGVELQGYGHVEVRCRVSCIGEGCPKPQLLTLKALNESQEGAVVEVITDNLSAIETIPSMMDIYGGQHIGTLRDEKYWRIYVRREAKTDSLDKH